jgi:hypothetical protein
MSLDNVKVHYNSARPAHLNALAYTQGSNIHVAPGQDQHLAHEAWHVVQQAQGRVRPTMQMKDGVAVNDNEALEREADVMGVKALAPAAELQSGPEAKETLQRKLAVAERTEPEQGNAMEHMPKSPSDPQPGGHAAQPYAMPATAQLRVITFDNEKEDAEVQYSAAVLAKSEEKDLARVYYDIANGGKNIHPMLPEEEEKEIFVGHSGGSLLGGMDPEKMAKDLAQGMDTKKSYKFVLAACKTGQDQNAFAQKLNDQLETLKMSQKITAPKNALTVVDAETFLQAEGNLDPWKFDTFTTPFYLEWGAVLNKILQKAAGPTILWYRSNDRNEKGKKGKKGAEGAEKGTEGAENKDEAPVQQALLENYLGRNKGLIKDFVPAPTTWNSRAKAQFLLGSRLEALVTGIAGGNQEAREKRVMEWLALSGNRDLLENDEMNEQRGEITKRALDNFQKNLNAGHKKQVHKYNEMGSNEVVDGDKMGDKAGWYKERKGPVKPVKKEKK